MLDSQYVRDSLENCTKTEKDFNKTLIIEEIRNRHSRNFSKSNPFVAPLLLDVHVTIRVIAILAINSVSVLL